MKVRSSSDDDFGLVAPPSPKYDGEWRENMRHGKVLGKKKKTSLILCACKDCG